MLYTCFISEGKGLYEFQGGPGNQFFVSLPHRPLWCYQFFINDAIHHISLPASQHPLRAKEQPS